jgi:hypothetical protein
MRYRSDIRTCFSAALAIAVCAGTVQAQPSEGRPGTGKRPVERGMAIDAPLTIYAVKGGFSAGPVQTPLDCTDVRSHSDFIFENPPGPQNVNAQAGFAQGESAAASYTLPASAFPVTLRKAEILFATVANVPTTTRWTVRIWSGTPTNGSVVHIESSDGSLIPHAVITPPANNALLSYQIDPNDPNQVVIQNNGSNTFTVEFRIDQHNNPPSNHCTTPPPESSNAFPATDTCEPWPNCNALQVPGGNWIRALECGALACPGGWHTFSSYPSWCRPSGDWVIRAVFDPSDCGTVEGACCFTNGTCQMLTSAACATQGGTYQGGGIQCGSANCATPTGACCFGGGGCTVLSSADCGTIGGAFQGAGTQCAGSNCPVGACCLPSGSCIGGVTMAQCAAQAGVFQGNASTCGGVTCPQPTGACCAPNGGCLVMTQANCALVPGAWAGPGTACGTTNCQSLLCYPNCDGSTETPVLNIADFSCFLTKFASGHSYANCDGSTHEPVLNVADFSCFLTKFAAGCP